MNSDQQSSSFDRDPRPPQRPPGPIAKLFALLLGAAFLVLAFMFSLVALAVVAVGGLALWGWLWWKTRALRKQMQATAGLDPQIIEGEFVRHQDEPRRNLPPQQ
jgi:4-hydroxybenzoate polyprenyltransferase